MQPSIAWVVGWPSLRTEHTFRDLLKSLVSRHDCESDLVELADAADVAPCYDVFRSLGRRCNLWLVKLKFACSDNTFNNPRLGTSA